MGGAPSIPSDPSRKLQVIGAGYSRTGTVSTALALEKLLGGPVMHGGTQILWREDAYVRRIAQAYEAKRAGEKERLHKLLKEIFAGFVACTDLPPIDFLPDLLEVYPDAKVVLVTRDPESWAKSIQMINRNVGIWWLPLLMWPVPGWRWFPTLIQEFHHSAKRFYQEDGTERPAPKPQILINWHEKVKEIVPADKLLVMDLKQGWEPLCEFLNVPVPDCALPRANDAAAAEKAAKDIIGKLLGIWCGFFVTSGTVAFVAWHLWKKW